MASYYTIGSKGDDVKKLQQALISAGYNVGSSGADGIYGKDTQAAVKAYQKANNLAQDGIAGAQTLGSLYAPKPATTQPVQQIVQQPVQPVQSAQPTPNLSSLSNFNMNPATTLPEYKSPFESQITSLLDKVLSYDPNAPYDVTTDPQYAPLKQKYEDMGETAFQDTVGDLSSLTGGRLNTWATSAASQAKNKYMNEFNSSVLPSLINNEMTRRANVYSNLASQLKTLQGLDSENYSRYRDTLSDKTTMEDRAKQDFLDTIGQYYDDFQARINILQNDGDPSNDWQIPYLKSERQNKIAGQQSAESKANAEAYDNALAMWKMSGVASKAVADILGVPVGAKTADYNLGSMNAQTARINATKKSGSGDDAKSTLTNTQIFNQAKAMLNEKVPTGDIGDDGNPVYRAKYTKEQFETWLDSVLPKTAEGDKMFDDIVNALNVDNFEFYEKAPDSRGRFVQNEDGTYVRQ